MKNRETEKYVAFLRGINVGGHHKLPMADLRKELKNLGYKNIVTILNSGNVIFDSEPNKLEYLEKRISDHLEKTFGFPVPAIIRLSSEIEQIFQNAPFKKVEVNKNIRLYVSFSKNKIPPALEVPWKSLDNSYQIIGKQDKVIFSVLDLFASKTIKAMEVIEKIVGKNITTRNWNTIVRIANKLNDKL